MNHKLQLTIHTDLDAGPFSLQVGGCLTGATFPVLLRAVVRAGRMTTGPVTLDLRGALHLDPDVLLHLRTLTDPATAAPLDNAAGPGQELPPLTVVEPAELPVCLAHVAIDGEVLDRLQRDRDSHFGGCSISHGPGGENDLIDGLELCQYYEGTLDPASTVRALSDDALRRLTDALYTHLDSPEPSFGSRTWFELATDEVDRRSHQTPAPAPAKIQPGTAQEQRRVHFHP